MSLRTFILGLVASFGLAWMLVLVMPFIAMRQVRPVYFEAPAADAAATAAAEPPSLGPLYHPKRAGRTVDGALVYAANGCNQCHSQLVRPTYAGRDMFRDGWGGLAADPDRGDTRRETNVFDFQGERHAFIGVARIGPDLSNLGRRLEAELGAEDPTPEQWLYRHLYDPRSDPRRAYSVCPANRFMFRMLEVRGARSADAVPVEGQPPGIEVLPKPEARALVSYLLNLRKDDRTPASMTPPTETELAGAAAE